jgi:hypothetical protein
MFAVASRYPDGPKVLEVACANPTCGKAVALTGMARTNARKRGRGYCSLECGKDGKLASLSVAKSVHWRGDEVGYGARYIRLGKSLGGASGQRCFDCDRPAVNANVPAERLRADASGQCQALLFSIRDSDYSARCKKCHAKLDRGVSRRAA